MSEYKEAYILLFRAVTAALEEIQERNYGRVKNLLIEGQQNAEEAFISAIEKKPPIIVIKKNEP